LFGLFAGRLLVALRLVSEDPRSGSLRACRAKLITVPITSAMLSGTRTADLLELLMNRRRCRRASDRFMSDRMTIFA